MNLKMKNTLITMAVLSGLLLTVVGITYRSTTAIVEQAIDDHQQAIAEDAAKTTEIWLTQQMKILNATAESIDYNSFGNNPETLRPLKMAMKAGHFSDVYIGTTDGVLIDGADWIPPEDYDPRHRPWFKRALEAGETAFTTPYIDLVTMELVIAMVTPLHLDGRFLGVMGADTVLDNLVDNLIDIKIGETGYAFLVEKSGTILGHPNQEFVMKVKLQETEPDLRFKLDRFQQSSAGVISYLGESAGKEHILAYKKIANTEWFLCTTVPHEEAYQLARKTTLLFAAEMVLKVLGALALLTLIGVGGSVLVLVVFSRRFQSTVQQHQEQLTGINQDLAWNISKRKEVETYYQTLFNVANDAILLSKNLQYVECNEKAHQLFGVSRLGLIGRNMLEISPTFQPDGRSSRDRVYEIINSASAEEPQFFEWTFKRFDGTEFPAEVGLKTLNLDNEELILSSIRDISKRVDAEGQLRQAQKMAAMGEMLGAIAHQWRQPLNTLSTYVASIQSAYYNDKISKEFVETLTSGADSQIQFMSKTIDDFRHFFRPSKKKIPFDLVEAVNSAVKLMQAQLKQSGIGLTLSHLNNNGSLIVYGYQSEFVHVVVNILANARDAVENKLRYDQSAGKFPIEIDIRSEADDIYIGIIDHGCGIPNHLLDQIFTPYFTTKGTSSGTGLGLYMSKTIIEKEMSGHLSAENTEDGACFTIKLPKAKLSDKARTEDASCST
ncbi:MAG: cache domain-containing protein [Desulfuromonadales bacterium]|nr:cache domain-containing protein [Desulfuromonadales bacterium]